MSHRRQRICRICAGSTALPGASSSSLSDNCLFCWLSPTQSDHTDFVRPMPLSTGTLASARFPLSSSAPVSLLVSPGRAWAGVVVVQQLASSRARVMRGLSTLLVHRALTARPPSANSSRCPSPPPSIELITSPPPSLQDRHPPLSLIRPRCWATN